MNVNAIAAVLLDAGVLLRLEIPVADQPRIRLIRRGSEKMRRAPEIRGSMPHTVLKIHKYKQSEGGR